MEQELRDPVDRDQVARDRATDEAGPGYQADIPGQVPVRVQGGGHGFWPLLPKTLRIAAEKLRELTNSPGNWGDLEIAADLIEKLCEADRASDLGHRLSQVPGDYNRVTPAPGSDQDVDARGLAWPSSPTLTGGLRR